MAVYDTIGGTIVFKKLELTTFTFGAGSMPQLRVSSGSSFFGIFNDAARSFTVYEIGLNFTSDDFTAFSDFGALSFTTESTSASTFTFTSDSKSATVMTPTYIDNAADASLAYEEAIYGILPNFKSFTEDFKTICFDNITSFPYLY